MKSNTFNINNANRFLIRLTDPNSREGSGSNSIWDTYKNNAPTLGNSVTIRQYDMQRQRDMIEKLQRSLNMKSPMNKGIYKIDLSSGQPNVIKLR